MPLPKYKIGSGNTEISKIHEHTYVKVIFVSIFDEHLFSGDAPLRCDDVVIIITANIF